MGISFLELLLGDFWCLSEESVDSWVYLNRQRGELPANEFESLSDVTGWHHVTLIYPYRPVCIKIDTYICNLSYDTEYPYTRESRLLCVCNLSDGFG